MSTRLIKEIRRCTVCGPYLPFAPRPVLQFSARSPIVIVGQAPGIRVHESGIPWNDPSGQRLRQWLQVDSDCFYDTSNFSIVPMGFCYPGSAARGDLPPRAECAELWMQRIMRSIKGRQMVLLVGQYAQAYFLGNKRKSSLTETVRHWREYLPDFFVVPHPSPRNNIWLKKNPWFEEDVLPGLLERVHSLLKT